MSTDSPALSALDDTTLRFDVAHLNAPTNETTCGVCTQRVRAEYYEIEGKVVCAACRAKLAASTQRGGRTGFARALGYGALASLAAAAAYSAFKIATGYDVGLVAILVGYAVGKAVHVGSGKRGGRRFQLLAVTLTYFTISLSHLPSVMHEYKESHKAELDSVAKVSSARKAAQIAASTSSHDSSGSGAGSATAIATPPSTQSTTVPAVGTAGADTVYKPTFGGGVKGTLIGLGGVVLLLAALPIMVGVSSIFSVFMLALALMRAWRMNRAVPLRITGPYRIADLPPAELPST